VTVQIAQRQSYKEMETVLLIQFMYWLAFMQTTQGISANLQYSLHPTQEANITNPSLAVYTCEVEVL
jgi:hypothetical protein